MTRHSHRFPCDTDPTSKLIAEAHAILADPSSTEGERKAAQRCIDTDGEDSDDLIYFLAEQEAWENRFDEPELTRSQRFYMSPVIAMELNARRIAREDAHV